MTVKDHMEHAERVAGLIAEAQQKYSDCTDIQMILLVLEKFVYMLSPGIGSDIETEALQRELRRRATNKRGES